MARPISWHTKIAASKEALAFYEALVVAHEAGAFKECHVFSGAVNRNGVPIVGAAGGTTTAPLSQVVAGFLGLRVNGRQQCSTRGCMNPLHYSEAGGPQKDLHREWDETAKPQREVSELKDAIEWLRDSKDIHGPKTFSFYRSCFPLEDMSNLELKRAWEALPSSWKQE